MRKPPFTHDVFLSHSAKDKAVVRPLAERLRAGLKVSFDEWMLKPGDSIPAKIEEGLERSRVLVLCMSANAFGSDWAQLEAGTFRFRDPLNKERRFIPLRLDDTPIKGSLAQFLYINWRPADREHEYAKLLEACRPPISAKADGEGDKIGAIRIFEGHSDFVNCVTFSADGRRALSGSWDRKLLLWDIDSGECLQVFKGHTNSVKSVVLSADGRLALSGSGDKPIRLWNVARGECLRLFKGHTSTVYSVKLSIDGRRALSGAGDGTMRLWDVLSGKCLFIFHVAHSPVFAVDLSIDERYAISGSFDKMVRLWDLKTGQCVKSFAGHTGSVEGVNFFPDSHRALSCSADKTLRIWDLETGRCLRVLEGHSDMVHGAAIGADGRYAISCSGDKTLRLWSLWNGRCVNVLKGHTRGIYGVSLSPDGKQVLSSSWDQTIRLWNLSEFVSAPSAPKTATPPSSSVLEQIQYTNAKVLVVGDTNAGKTGLTHRLATGTWKPSEDSTVGAWSTQWKLKDANSKTGVEREIWLWDFGGQADQRLIHQLYMDRTALILLLFNSDKEDVLPGLRDWQTALRRCVKAETPQILVAGRIDTGFKASRGKLQAFAKEQRLEYHETSAKDGSGCDKLYAAIFSGIAWDKMPVTTTERLFKRIKDEILKLRDEGQVLHTFKELREELWRRLPDEPRFTDDTLKAVISLLDGPGVVKELDYGTYILLAPEWINTYAQAVLRTLRSDEKNLAASLCVVSRKAS